jgi:uncharacterized membrane protein
MRRSVPLFVATTAALVLPAVTVTTAAAQESVVRAVLFFSPTCPHCAEVIQQDLPIFFAVHGGDPQLWMDESLPAQDRIHFLFYNEQLEILLIDASLPDGGRLYLAAAEYYRIPDEREGVPLFIMGDSLLVGAVEIPTRFHDLMERARARGGHGWPTFTGLADFTAGLPSAVVALADEEAAPDARTDSASAPATPEAPTEGRTDTTDETRPTHRGGDTADQPVGAPASPPPDPAPADSILTDSLSADTIPSVFESVPERPLTFGQKFGQDPAGNTLAVVLLVSMTLSVLGLPLLARLGPERASHGPAVPVLAILGLGVAAYLTYVEASGAVAVCGPVGDCNTVQQSEYATLFGVLPVGVLGLIGYLAILGAWGIGRGSRGPAGDWATVLLLVGTVAGTLFSIYLTFLEPFVIGATCAWCLTSAVATTALMWLSAKPGATAWSHLRGAGR